MKIQLCPFNKIFLDLSYVWLHDTEIKYLTNSSDFTKEEQKVWFETLKDRKDYVIWGIKADGLPIGVCGIKNISDSEAEYWGYIGDKMYWGLGIGKEIMRLIEDEARELKISSIWLKVINCNKRAIDLYEKHGYIFEKEIDTVRLMRKYL